jgi:hypothetical protein
MGRAEKSLEIEALLVGVGACSYNQITMPGMRCLMGSWIPGEEEEIGFGRTAKSQM